MRLCELLKGVEIVDFRGNADLEICGLSHDSRTIKAGDLFVAVRGEVHDGHEFIGEALERGAVAVVAETSGRTEKRASWVRVSDSRATLSDLAVRFYGRPYEGLRLIGITGTNGKTTTSYLLESILFSSGARPGVIGTITTRFPGFTSRASVTTPESLDLMQVLRKMKDAEVTDVVMEVSSHALAQGRVRNCPFQTAIFTNLSRDHLDYHPDMAAYFEAKSRLFQGLAPRHRGQRAKAVINMDDPKGVELLSLTDGVAVSYGLSENWDVSAHQIHADMEGIRALLKTPSGEVEVWSPLIGEFNIYNILAASAAAVAMGIDLEAVAQGISNLRVVPGRLEPIQNQRSISILVDYAHTSDALLQALRALRPLVKGRVLTVFGCGGDRDKGKRPEMGKVAGQHSDLVVVTSDNPRNEEPEAITAQIEEGIRLAGLKRLPEHSPLRGVHRGYTVELDREKAIGQAIQGARPGDLVLIAGKGHEDYQIIKGQKRAFDDRKVAAAAATQGG